MTFRKYLVLGAAVAMIGVAATGALAQTSAQKSMIDAAKAQGVVGEQADGYLGVVGSVSGSVRAQVDSINIQRRAYYTDLAGRRGA
ncbi:MAG TPA: DUF1318 domain-containing protein, partial [Brevundimonas sp.]